MSGKYLVIIANGLVLSTLARYCHNIINEESLSIPRISGIAMIVFLALFVQCFLLVVLYRILWHPLAKYPGPFWGTLTDWYSVYHIVKGDRHIDFYRLHEKHGKVVRFGPRRISVRSATALKDIYHVNANVKRSKVYASTAHFFGGTPSSNTTPDMKEHAFRRRVNVRALNPKSIKGMEEQILKNIRHFCDVLVDGDSEGWSSSRDMSRVVGYLISDIMGDITFSKSFDVQRKPDNRDVLSSLPKAVAGIHLLGYMPELLVFRLEKIFFRNLTAAIARFTSLSASTLQWRFPQEGCKDLFSALLQAQDEKTGKGFSTDQLVAEAGLFTIAGSDTTITATTAVFFYLAHYPVQYAELRKDIDSTFDSVEDIRIGEKLASCHYLLACIEETLRVTPPVGSTLMREVLPGGLTVDGEWFPPGTDIAVPHYALHHDEEYFPEPFKCNPKRWLTADSSNTVKVGLDMETEDAQGQASAFTAFGFGRTSCIGKYLAYQEISLIVARTVFLFDMRLEPGSTLGEGNEKLGTGREKSKEFQTWDRFVSTHDGPMLQFKLRNP